MREPGVVRPPSFPVSLALVLALETVALLLIRFGPGSEADWAPKALAVTIGGLLLVTGAHARSLVRTARIDGYSPDRPTERVVTAAEVLAGRAPVRVALRGTAEPEAGMEATLPVAPLSGARCLAYHLGVARHGQERPNSSDAWTTVLHEEAVAVDFRLRDATGSIRVVATGTAVRGVPSADRAATFADLAAVAGLEQELRAAGVAVVLAPDDPHGRADGVFAEEEVLLPGHAVHVAGPVALLDGQPALAGDSTEPVRVVPAAEDDLAAATRRLTAAARAATALLPVAGLGLVAAGLLWILTT
jgi:hypothetical protein